MSGTCKDCEHWHGGNCHFHDEDIEGDDRATPKAAYEEGAFLQTGPDFGCIHFAPKTNT